MSPNNAISGGESPGLRCTITGMPVTKLGSRKAVDAGDADGIFTNVGVVGRDGLGRYDEAVNALPISVLTCAHSVRKTLKKALASPQTSPPEASS